MRYRIKKVWELIKKRFEINSKTVTATWFMIALLLLLTGSHYFWLGFHNFDVAQNIERLGDDMNMVLCEFGYDERWELGETNLYGDEYTLSDTYRMGLRQLVWGFYLTVAGCILVGMFIGSLFVPKEGKRK
jgi:hypothetical protein